MITLISGNDTLSSRKYFLDLQDKDSLSFDAESINLVELEQSLGGSGLFGSTKKIFVENLFSRKSIKNLEPIGKLLTQYKDTEIFFWTDKEVSVKALGSFPKVEKKEFKIPQSIWNFLDNLRPSSTSNVSSFHRTLNETEPEIIFAMILRQFRLMLGLLKESNEKIDELKRIAPWQKTKLVRQASLFGEEKLKKIYKSLYKIDKATKTGKTNLTLTQNIDILLLQI